MASDVACLFCLLKVFYLIVWLFVFCVFISLSFSISFCFRAFGLVFVVLFLFGLVFVCLLVYLVCFLLRLNFFLFAFCFDFLVYFVFVLSFTIICLHVKLRIYEAMGGKSHDMNFCAGAEIRQWKIRRQRTKTLPQDSGTGRC